MKEIKSCLIEYIDGNIVAINLNKTITIYYSKSGEHESMVVTFFADDYYTFYKNRVTESSWGLLHAMMHSL